MNLNQAQRLWAFSSVEDPNVTEMPQQNYKIEFKMFTLCRFTFLTHTKKNTVQCATHNITTSLL